MRGPSDARPARLPGPVARILASTERRLARARRMQARYERWSSSPPVNQLSGTLARATRLSAARSRAGRAEVAAAFEPRPMRRSVSVPVAREPAPAASPPWWARLGEEFGVSDWALQQLFGDTDASLPAAPQPAMAAAEQPAVPEVPSAAPSRGSSRGGAGFGGGAGADAQPAGAAGTGDAEDRTDHRGASAARREAAGHIGADAVRSCSGGIGCSGTGRSDPGRSVGGHCRERDSD